MVGLFHLGNKASPSRTARSSNSTRPLTPPPPPYGQNGPHPPPVFASETTTTTTHVVTTTTLTTTHFFSLPLWRRRAQQSATSNNPAPDTGANQAADELGTIHSVSTPAVLMRDKDLPPTPPSDGESLASCSRRTAQYADRDAADDSRASIHVPAQSTTPSRSSSAQRLPPSTHSEPVAGPTATLARVALGLGLPPLMLDPSLGSAESSSDINTVSFVASPNTTPLPVPRASSSSMRRAKSFQKDTSIPAGTSHSEFTERRRARGFSLGPLQLGSEEKGKEKEPERKSLSRKGSFWSRKRNDSRTPTPAVPLPSEQYLQRPSLPSLQPVSPFRIDTDHQSSSLRPDDPNAPQASELRRRHSERTPSQAEKSPPHAPSQPTSPKSPHLLRRPQSKRPQTADSAGSPRAVSSFFPSPTSASSLSSGPILTPPGHNNESVSPISPVPQITTSRPRSQTNPPFLHRLSMNLFGPSSTPSPVNGSAIMDDLHTTASPRTSMSSGSRLSVSRPSPKVSVEIPRPRHEEESPEVYLERLLEAVSKAEVATVLASSADEFHAHALRSYISRFNFSGDPLDVALRRLLMDVGLPKETQQIDRVIEAFAACYRYRHPQLFTSDDHPYVLAFSLIMLHTDAFNKSNKRKMSKADYVKNTRLPGVPAEVLDCFYDNIVFAPFIFIEDPLDVNGQRGLLPDGPSRRLSTLNAPSPGGLNGSGSTLLGKTSKIDPYYLITRNLLDDLRVDVRSYVPPTSPYYYLGTAGPWDEDKLLQSFATANVVELASENRYLSAPWFGLNVGGGPASIAMSAAPTYPPIVPIVASLKVTKVGLLFRKDEVLEGGRKASSRKWKEMSVLLTGSQLLFSRDPTWAGAVQAQSDPTNGQVSFPHGLVPRPDELLSVKDAVAVYDRSYTKYDNTLRLALPDGRHFLFKAKDDREMNEWIACINYASAFKTAGVRMRSLGMSGQDIELTGQAAAVSHLRDLQQKEKPTMSPRIRSYGRPSTDVEQIVDGPTSPTSDPDEPTTPPMENSSRLFKATFDQVKADLASGNWQSLDAMSLHSSGRPRAYSLESTLNSPTSPASKTQENGERLRLSSRAQIIRSKVHDLDTRLALQQSQLDSDMRFVQNMAVLTPFQRATRDRLQLAVQNVAKRVMQVRLDLEKLKCHRDVLSKDLAAEERDWQRTKNMALRAATEKLQVERKQSLPRMTLSMYMDEVNDPVSSPIDIPRNSEMADSLQTEASATALSHSAPEYHSDWTGYLPDDQRQTLPVGDTSHILNSPTATVLSKTSPSRPPSFPDSPRPSQLSTQSSIESTIGTPDEGRTSEDKFYSAPETPEEQAEEWNKTRAAKRVSLVRLPSDLRMTALFGRHARTGSEVVSSDASTITPSTRSNRSASSPTSPFGRTNSTVDNVAMLDL